MRWGKISSIIIFWINNDTWHTLTCSRGIRPPALTGGSWSQYRRCWKATGDTRPSLLLLPSLKLTGLRVSCLVSSDWCRCGGSADTGASIGLYLQTERGVSKLLNTSLKRLLMQFLCKADISEWRPFLKLHNCIARSWGGARDRYIGMFIISWLVAPVNSTLDFLKWHFNLRLCIPYLIFHWHFNW